MGYAALMVHAGPDAAAEARLRLAADLADRFDAALIGLASGAIMLPAFMPPPGTAPVFSPAVAVEVFEAEQQRVEAGAARRARAVPRGRGAGRPAPPAGGPSSTTRPMRWRARPGPPTC